MIDKVKIAFGILCVIISIFFLNVSSPNYGAVLSMSAGSAAMAVVLLAISARHAVARKKMVLRLATGIALVIACYSGWGVLSTLSLRSVFDWAQ